MLPSNSQLVRDGIRAGLYPPDTLGALDERARQQGEPTNEEEVARLLVLTGVVTPFQARLMLQKRTRLLFAGPYTILEPAGVCELCRYFHAVHRGSGRKYLLGIQRVERADEASTAEFVRLAKMGEPSGRPATRFEGFLALGKTKVAVFRTPENDRSTAEMSSVQTVDGLPVVEDAEPGIDLSGLFDEEPAPSRAGDPLADEDEPIALPKPASASFGEPVSSYALRERPAPKRRRNSVRKWLVSTKMLIATLGIVIVCTLILLLRHALRAGM